MRRRLPMRRGRKAATHWTTVQNQSADSSAFLAVTNAGISQVQVVASPSFEVAAGAAPSIADFTVLAVKGHISWRNTDTVAHLVRAGLVVADVDASGVVGAAELVGYQVFGNSGLIKPWAWLDQRFISPIASIIAGTTFTPGDRPTMQVDMQVRRRLVPGRALVLLLETDAGSLMAANVNVRALISRVA